MPLFHRWLVWFIFPTLLLFFANNIAIGSTNYQEVRLSGTLVSTNGRSALINGKMVREGDRVAGVRILAIDEQTVSVLSGNEQRILRVGATANLQAASPMAHLRTPKLDSEPKQRAGTRQVKRGDTLSAIARDYLAPDVTLDQVMLALFEANPEAFDDNVNRLYAGATLRIPTNSGSNFHSRTEARQEVARQTIAWLNDRAEQPRSRTLKARASVPDTYGPVKPGETLYGIAIHLATPDVTPQRMMMALFDANRDAFGNDMDLLHAGAVLQVPSNNGVFAEAMAHAPFP